MKYNVKRWLKTSTELQKFEQILEDKQKLRFLNKLHLLAIEKDFLLQLKAKYCGVYGISFGIAPVTLHNVMWVIIQV